MSSGSEIISLVGQMQDLKAFRDQHWEGTFEEYLETVRQHPEVTRTAFQRIYDLILSKGWYEYYDHKKRIIHYNFFDDVDGDGRDAIYGLDIPIMKLVNAFKSAAQRYGTEKRVLLLHGPVGSSKSTIVRLLKKGLESYSRTPEGALYTFSWLMSSEYQGRRSAKPEEEIACPMHEEPLHLIPEEARPKVFEVINRGKPEAKRVVIEGDLCPACRQYYRELNIRYRGDWTKIVGHVRVFRSLLSEKDRIGIGTFQPKDEKNQDSTELTGDINYRKIAEFGSDSDPRAFNFDGEFNIANRGVIEFIEVLKLDVAFLYDLLGASQEHKIKPKKFAQTDIDEVIIGHTNEPEYRRLQNNEFMEA
ncbi:MAG TPA: serine protein kinase, partial [Candidatus Polarisedimenticolia bacterium]|nr:serine protein kinase [Candidatus Polarisedimenticolia bacterium]